MELWVLIGVSIVGAAFGVVITRRLSGTTVAATVGATCAESGADAALEQLNTKIPPLVQVAYFRVLAQRERAAMLAMLGEVKTLQSEQDARGGSLLQQANIDAVALMGLAITDPNRKPHAEALQALAERIKADGGMTMAVLRKRVEAYAGLAKYLAGKNDKDFDGKMRWAVEDVIATENGALPVLLSLGLDEAMRRAGKDDLRGPHKKRILASGFREKR